MAIDQGKANVHLSISEKAVVSAYALDVDNSVEIEDLSGEDMPGFIDEGNIEYESKRQKKQPPYRSTLHISPTPNIVERLFSRCGIIMRSHRRLMDPSTLEMLVMLRFNRDTFGTKEILI